MDGHAVQIGGVIVDSGKFDWTCGIFSGLTEPDESYHGISYTGTYGKKAYIVKARMQLMRDFGVYPAAHSAFLLNLGLETLAVRMKQYCENALAVARYLKKSRYVEYVNYPIVSVEKSVKETGILKISSNKAKNILGWDPKYSIDDTLRMAAEFAIREHQGEPVREICMEYIDEYWKQR